MRTIEEIIRAALEPEIIKLARETQERVNAFAEKWGVTPEEVTVESNGTADPGVHLSLRAKKKY